jgi:hypothetical protein
MRPNPDAPVGLENEQVRPYTSFVQFTYSGNYLSISITNSLIGLASGPETQEWTFLIRTLASV